MTNDSGRRIISFSLFGENDLYLKGAIENVECWRAIYPEWEMHVYYDKDNHDCSAVAKSLVTQWVKIIPMQNTGGCSGAFWRFLAASDPNAEYAIFRDADSRLNVRERAAVDAWIASDKAMHVMRDHPQHGVPMLAGMWGIRGGVITDMEARIENWAQRATKGDDQNFLAWRIWPHLKHDCLQHGLHGEPWPEHAPFDGFVGQTIGPRE